MAEGAPAESLVDTQEVLLGSHFRQAAGVQEGVEFYEVLADAGVRHVEGAVAADGEDDQRGEDRGGGVHRGDDDGVLEAVVVARVVRRERDDSTESESQREEDLRGGGGPDFVVFHETPVRGEHVGDSGARSVKGERVGQETGKHDVGVEGDELGDLSDLFDTAKDKGAHANPGDDQAYGEVRHQVSHRVHVTAHLQHLVVEEVICWRRLQALGVCCDASVVATEACRAASPHFDVAKYGVVQMVDGPRDDDVVVDGDVAADYETGPSDTDEERIDLQPGEEAAGVEPLPDGHLEVVEREAEEHERDGVREDEGASAVFLAQVRESPHVAEADSESDLSEDVSEFVVESLGLLFRFFLSRFCNCHDLVQMRQGGELDFLRGLGLILGLLHWWDRDRRHSSHLGTGVGALGSLERNFFL